MSNDNAKDLLRAYEEAADKRRKQVARLETALREIRTMAREGAKGAKGRGEDYSLRAFQLVGKRAQLALTQSTVSTDGGFLLPVKNSDR